MKRIFKALVLSLFTCLSLCSCSRFLLKMLERYREEHKYDTPAEAYYRTKELSLENPYHSDADGLLYYLQSYCRGSNIEANKEKYGEKFFLAFVQKDCVACDERYEAFETLEKEWNKGSFEGLDREFRLYTIFVDSVDKDGKNLFEPFYSSAAFMNLIEDAVSHMNGNRSHHPYRENTNIEQYDRDLENVLDFEQFTTPTTFLFDLTTDNPADWTSAYGVREALFSFSGKNGTDKYAMARTLRNAWTNDWGNDGTLGVDNEFSLYYWQN